jgi:GNAT superfamily N-acetyltransferase
MRGFFPFASLKGQSDKRKANNDNCSGRSNGAAAAAARVRYSAMITIHSIELPVPGMEQLQAEALQEGFLFIERLWEEWQNGKNRFAAPGEKLYGCWDDAGLVAIGGLSQDPFDGLRGVGRIRRVYVRPAWRNRGIGEALLHTLVESARTSFTALHLRTDNPTAARLYERIGFSRILALHATHVLDFGQTPRPVD